MATEPNQPESREHLDLLAFLADNAPVALEVCDSSGNLRFSSRTYRRWFQREEANGQTSVLASLSDISQLEISGSQGKAIDIFSNYDGRDEKWKPLRGAAEGTLGRPSHHEGIRYFSYRESQYEDLIVRWFLNLSDDWQRERQLRQGLHIGNALLEAVFRTKRDEQIAGFRVISHPRDTVGGDFAIARRSPDGRYGCVVVGDCSGHGIPGAILASLCGVVIDQFFDGWHQNFDPVHHSKSVVDFLNRRLYTVLHEGRIVAPSMGRSMPDPLQGFHGLDGGVVVFEVLGADCKLSICCGNFTAWVRTHDKVQVVGRMDTVREGKSIGLDPESVYEEVTLTVPTSSSSFFLATDGALSDPRLPDPEAFRDLLVRGEDLDVIMDDLEGLLASQVKDQSDDLLIAGLSLAPTDPIDRARATPCVSTDI